jgi:sterol desaturase/sphingolipid hydroxylase (fatty acid hydroxylase superfamily)
MPTYLMPVLIVTLPLFAFVALVLGERLLPTVPTRGRETGTDVMINLSGFAMQGAVIPALGYFVSAALLPRLAPAAEGVLGLGFCGAFLLCFVGVDALYYCQHRAFHRLGALWRLHRCHHAAPALSVWATARNSLLTHFLFVYLLVNPWLAYLSGSIQGFLLAASVTASLDLWRHSRLAPKPYWLALEWLLITPRLHHQHHDAAAPGYNFGANLSLWDRLLGTLRKDRSYPVAYAVPDAPDAWSQLVHPLATGRSPDAPRHA